MLQLSRQGNTAPFSIDSSQVKITTPINRRCDNVNEFNLHTTHESDSQWQVVVESVNGWRWEVPVHFQLVSLAGL